MFFDCRVYDKEGKLVRVHTAKELEEADDKKCQKMLPKKERFHIINFEKSEVSHGFDN